MRFDDLLTEASDFDLDPELHETLTTPECALVKAIWSGVENPIKPDTPIWANEFGEYEPVTPGVLICYLRNESICNEWPATLINHCRFLLEEMPDAVQQLARSCYYFWESRRRRPQVDWVSEGF